MANGFGISLLPTRAVTSDHKVLGINDGLSPITAFEIAVFHRPTTDPVVKELADVLIQIVDEEGQ